MEQIFENTQQFSSQMLANRKYIKSIKEIMGTTFKLNIKLTSEEKAVFALFNVLNDMYVDLRMNPAVFMEKLMESDDDDVKQLLGSDLEPKSVFNNILKKFSKSIQGEGEDKGIVFFY